LDLSKAEAGKTDMVCTSLPCVDVITEVKSTLQPLADTKELAFEVLIDDPTLMVYADRRALQQVLLNLASNAIKFTDQGQVVIAASRIERNSQPRIAIAVRDSGIGISAADQLHLFQAFSRVFRESSKRREGTGLGLHLSRKLAQMMDGDIFVHSEPGQGSTFTLDLKAG
jgi:protein-histidine pros-kinase